MASLPPLLLLPLLLLGLAGAAGAGLHCDATQAPGTPVAIVLLPPPASSSSHTNTTTTTNANTTGLRAFLETLHGEAQRRADDAGLAGLCGGLVFSVLLAGCAEDAGPPVLDLPPTWVPDTVVDWVAAHPTEAASCTGTPMSRFVHTLAVAAAQEGPPEPGASRYILGLFDDAPSSATEAHSELKAELSPLLEVLQADDAVTVVFGGRALSGVFGDPSLADVYRDGSHFNKAHTLKNLIQAGSSAGALDQADTLAAHLLAAGITARTHHLDAFAAVTAGTSPHLFPLHPDLSHAPDRAGPGNLYTDTLSASPIPQGPEQARIEKPSPLPRLDWAPETPFAAELVAGGRPVVLRNSSVALWPAVEQWADLGALQQLLAAHQDTCADVKVSANPIFWDPDLDTPLAAAGLHIPVTYEVQNMSAAELMGRLTDDGAATRVSYFSRLPDLAKPLCPDNHVFVADKDREKQQRFWWLSSKGQRTHTHFDQDYNFYAQVHGRKRFTLFPGAFHEQMHLFPRVHPLWHKSQLDFGRPALGRFPDYRTVPAQQIDLEPGDLLYIPPYTFHHVESLTASVSVSTLSDDSLVYDNMNGVYKQDHKFDLLGNGRGQMFALRLYLDLMVHELVGNHPNETSLFFQRLIHTRYRGLEGHFAPAANASEFCASPIPGKIPTARHVYGDCVADMRLISPRFSVLPATTRDILFIEYVEEIAAQVVGVENLLQFYTGCFQGRGYELTDPASALHAELWTYKDNEDDHM